MDEICETKEELQQEDKNPAETLLRYFALIEGKNKAFDKQKRIEYKFAYMYLPWFILYIPYGELFFSLLVFY